MTHFTWWRETLFSLQCWSGTVTAFGSWSVTAVAGNLIKLGETIEFFLPVTIVIIPDVLVTNYITKLY